MPKRLLEIFGSAEKPLIRLSTNHRSTAYVALSYCWGADQPAKTTTANLHDYLSEIPFDTLPLTIQHAAIVTRGIGLSNLWVDAMCIVQDDEEDKLGEISQMHAIYRNSWVTIAAAEARTCNDGFLQPRSDWQPVKMKARFDDNVFSEVTMFPRGQSCRPDAPLFQRGWTMQETLLSTRVLLYGARELTFLCMQDEQSEGGVPPTVRQYQMLFDPGSNTYVGMDHPESWGYLVSAYSQRKLSLEDDKLLGIGALAASYGRTKNTKEYFAGMWKENFLQQCLWTTQTYTSGDRVPRRPAKYRAPSWSWASTEGQVSSFGVSANMPAMMLPETMPPITTCEIVDLEVKTVPAGNPFGMVTDGHLKIRGKLRQIVWYNSGWSLDGYVYPLRDTDEPQLNERGRRVNPGMTVQIDHPKDWPLGEEILLWSLEICKTSEGQGYALLLNEAGGHNETFQRVGRLNVIERTNNWFDTEHELREIKIV
ncbi:hypothetical protein CkaCkLH20_03699 [Colletotrichum karsti]|uniref:Heterokaryon incompatibility domain-containing protein n=1 Tax=Colletotrichum karsti TaxID=1095194 RepID=A0A9P6IA68_9PEZI|nr:uncharacterized protein CkaCkLH20_03699 [Colletotrichum karsti]KAF9878799.1 hypothetical protein CkaCkLH20_03699 [Colletotrichum karsti]